MSLNYSNSARNSDSAMISDKGIAVNNKFTWDMLSEEIQEAIKTAIEEKRILVFPNGSKCQLKSLSDNNNTIICQMGSLFKKTVTIPISTIIQNQYELSNGGSKKMKKRGGSKRRRTKRLRKNKKTGRTRRRNI
jgi:hypothetical protein